jgi:hypothetical protein
MEKSDPRPNRKIKISIIRELDNQMQQALKQNSMHQQLLQHMIEQQDLEIYDLMLQVRALCKTSCSRR